MLDDTLAGIEALCRVPFGLSAINYYKTGCYCRFVLYERIRRSKRSV